MWTNQYHFWTPSSQPTWVPEWDGSYQRRPYLKTKPSRLIINCTNCIINKDSTVHAASCTKRTSNLWLDPQGQWPILSICYLHHFMGHFVQIIGIGSTRNHKISEGPKVALSDFHHPLLSTELHIVAPMYLHQGPPKPITTTPSVIGYCLPSRFNLPPLEWTSRQRVVTAQHQSKEVWVDGIQVVVVDL